MQLSLDTREDLTGMDFNSTHDTTFIPCTHNNVAQNNNDSLQFTSVLPTDVSFAHLLAIDSVKHAQNMPKVSVAHNFSITPDEILTLLKILRIR